MRQSARTGASSLTYQSDFRPVSPAKPVAAYIGGKRLLAGAIIDRIAAIPHDTYVEPFVGMGGVFLRRSLAPKSEVMNDINRDVATLFRVLQRHYAYFIDFLRFRVTARAEFERLRQTNPDTLTDLERAARYLYLQRLSYAGKPDAVFAVHPGSGARFNITRLESLLEAAHARLSGAIIECLPWADCIRRWDRPDTLFYLDPPYYRCEDYYGKGLFTRDDFGHLAEVLSGLKGRFIMSLNDAPEVRKIFGAFAIETVETTYYAGGGNNAKATTEVLITKP